MWALMSNVLLGLLIGSSPLLLVCFVNFLVTVYKLYSEKSCYSSAIYTCVYTESLSFRRQHCAFRKEDSDYILITTIVPSSYIELMQVDEGIYIDAKYKILSNYRGEIMTIERIY